VQEELGACQLDDALRESVRPNEDEPMPVLLGMVTGGKKGMDRGAIEECDLTQIQQDRVDIRPFEMRQVVEQERSRGQIELTYDGYVRDPFANINIHRTLLLKHDFGPFTAAPGAPGRGRGFGAKTVRAVD
jgi:hypothetical protein